MISDFRLKTLTIAMGMAMGVSASASPVSNNMVTTSAQHVPTLYKGEVVSGALAMSQPMHIVVSLKLRNQTQLQSFVQSMQSSSAPQPMTSEQFTAQHAPTQAQAQEVADYLKLAGFTNVEIAPNRLQVSADGTAATARSAFSTSFAQVKSKDGRLAYTNTSDVYIPAALQDSVLAVLGLQNVHVAHTFARVARSHAAQTDASGTAGGHNPVDFAAIYGGTGVTTGSTVPVGIITEGSMTNVLSDLKKFASNNGLPAVTTQVVGNGSSDTSGDGEWDLDSQDIVGISGGVQKIVFYDAASLSNADLASDYNAAVSANAVKIINVSLGECETSAQGDGSAASNDQTFQQAVAQGQTFSVSSGDSGADECGDGGVTPSWPASSQYVVAVGGTELFTSSTTWTNETVWNELASNEGATGGSPSTFEAMPSWQKNVGQNTGHTTRGVPDIAFNGDPVSGALVIVDGAQEQIGGTSLSSPLFVGSWARVLAAKGSNIGFAAPLIYQDAAAHAGDFHDITSGNNSGENAAAGWDYTTGFGSLILSNFVNNVNGGSSPPPPTGPAANFTDQVNGLAVNFTNSSTDSGGTITSYAWNFGDSGTSTATNPSHTYAAAGTYSVTLTVTDSNGKTNANTQSVTVAAGGGGGVFSNDKSVHIGDDATINSSISVTGQSGSAPSNLKVHVSIAHNWSGDLAISLVGPNGKKIALQNPDYNDDGNIDKTYTVNASSIPGNGTWKLRVLDDDPWYTGDDGTLNSWSITF